MAGGKKARRHQGLEFWERRLANAIAARIRTTERDDLESVLAVHLLELKRRWASKARNWRAFAATALRNKAANWVRDRQHAERRTTSLDEIRDQAAERVTLVDVAESVSQEDRAALSRAWDELNPDLREVWQMLLEEQGNQVSVARRLAKHRNTVRHLIRRIRGVLERHGFGDRR